MARVGFDNALDKRLKKIDQASSPACAGLGYSGRRQL
jgi:hypothetical protein